MLEEQLSDLRRHQEDELIRLKQLHRDEKQQLERDSRDRVEQLKEQFVLVANDSCVTCYVTVVQCLRIREMDASSHQYKTEVPRLTGQLELLKEDKQRLEDKIESRDATISQFEVKLARLQEEKERLQHAHERRIATMQWVCMRSLF